jgi:glutaminase
MLVAVQLSPLTEILDRVHRDLAAIVEGTVATYIPELGRADPRSFGIAVATVDGEVFGVGDSTLPFTIQSISKPLVFGMALEERGDAAVLDRVGVEPSGDSFNSVAVDAETSRPFNPMVNAGAIVSTSLLSGAHPAEDRERLRQSISRFAGRSLPIDEDVYRSEGESGDRNRAIAWLMSSFGMIDRDVEQIVDLYFAQCSILVNCRDLALIGATLANDGLNPITGERALSTEHITKVLSVMTTCGMYDHAGSWVYRVGIPAKSGVAGGVLAVLPGQLGIGVFSPPLDARGNSVRGIAVCERLSRELQLHLLGSNGALPSVVRRVGRGDEFRSNRVRTLADEEAIAAQRSRIALFELQGAISFSTAEKAHREIAARLDGVDYVVIDLTRVPSFDEPALGVLNRLAEALTDSGRAVLAVLGDADERTSAKLAPTAMSFLDVDAALEWCEDRLLETVGGARATGGSVFAHLELLEGLDAAELAAVQGAVDVKVLEPGTVVFREGDPADAVYFLLDGRVSVLLPLGPNSFAPARRLATFDAGVAFGEMALLADEARSADIVCDEQSTVASLSIEALQALGDDHPHLRATMQANLARLLSQRLRAANAQIRALAR